MGYKWPIDRDGNRLVHEQPTVHFEMILRNFSTLGHTAFQYALNFIKFLSNKLLSTILLSNKTMMKNILNIHV